MEIRHWQNRWLGFVQSAVCKVLAKTKKLHYIPVMWLLVSAANAHSDIDTTSWMILSNAWHGLQRLARKRSFHRLVRHSCCCLSFNGHKRKILQDTIEIIWSLLSILPAFCEGTDLFWKAKSVDKCSGGLKVNKPKSVGRLIEHFHGPQYVFKCCQRMTKTKCTDCVTMSLCHYVPMWCDFLFQQPLHIVTISWMILSNAWHGLQRLARKRSFHRLVWHSGCCLSFNGHKREILQDTIEVIWSLLSILHAFCQGTDLFWKAKSVDKCCGGLKVKKNKKCREVDWTFQFPWSAVCVQILPENDEDKMHWLRHYVIMSLCPYVMWLLVSAAIAHSYY